jgi:hypothetical protein
LRSVDERLVDERSKLARIVEVACGNELCHVNDDQLLGRVDPVLAVVGAAPAVLADRAGLPTRAQVLDDIEA